MGNACCPLALTAVLVLAAGFAAPAARAGVKIEMTHRVTGTNGASLTRRVLYFQGAQSRDETTITFTSPWMRKRLKQEGRANPSSQVIIDHADDNREFVLDADNKTYAESSLYSPAQVKMISGSPASSTQAHAVSSEQLRTIEVKYEVEPTGHIKIINGFKAREYRLIVQEEFEDRKTGQVSRVRNIETLWNSTDTRVMAAYRDYMNYNRRVAKLWHTTLSMDMIQQLPMIQMPFAFFGDHRPSGSDPLGRLPGFPVEIATSLEAECLSHCKPRTDRTRPQQANRAPASVSAADRADPQNSAQPTGTRSIPVEMPIMHTEILSITLGKLPGSLFAPPAGYTKKN